MQLYRYIASVTCSMTTAFRAICCCLVVLLHVMALYMACKQYHVYGSLNVIAHNENRFLLAVLTPSTVRY